MMDPSLSVELLANWTAAATAAWLPTQDTPWTIASLFAFPGRARVFAAGSGGQPTAFAPLVQRGALLELPGCRATGEPVDFFAGSEQAMATLAAEIARSRRPLVLERLPADSPTIPALREAYGGRATIRLEEKIAFPTIPLEESWKEPGGGLSSSRRSSLRRGRRKAEKHGEVTVDLLSPTPEELEPLIDEAFDVERRSWKGLEGTAVAFVAQMDAFYRRYALELAQRGQFRLDFLRIDGRAVAMQYGAVWKDRHWLFKIGYDAAFHSASPGQVLLAEGVAAAARAGLHSYELLGAQAEWTDAWTKQVQPCTRVVVLPHGPRGALGAGALRTRALSLQAVSTAKTRGKQLIRKAEDTYVCGAELSDVMPELERYVAAGYETSVGFWPGVSDTRDKVTAEAFAGAETLPAGSEVAIKLDSFGTEPERLDSLLETATGRELTVHIDAVGAGIATESQEVARRLHDIAPGKVGCTLPGRWRRSAADAVELAGSGLRIRVVKGEFEDPNGEVDLAEGFLEVVDALAGGSCHVEIATQDTALAERALTRLVESGTSCELQVLYAMRCRGVVAVARKLGLPVRVYIPYGSGRLPYDRGRVTRHPTLRSKVVRDALPLPPRRPPGA